MIPDASLGQWRLPRSPMRPRGCRDHTHEIRCPSGPLAGSAATTTLASQKIPNTDDAGNKTGLIDGDNTIHDTSLGQWRLPRSPMRPR
eukprot:5361426-Pyramimonas_sp.AAC.1